VNTEALQQLDAELFLLVNRLDAPAWELVAGYGTQLGNGALLAVLLLVGLRLFDRRRFPKNFLLIGLAMAVAGLASTALKATTNHPRPLRKPVFELSQEPIRSRVLAGGLPVHEYAVGNPELAALERRAEERSAAASAAGKAQEDLAIAGYQKQQDKAIWGTDRRGLQIHLKRRRYRTDRRFLAPGI